jgi:hypothetical protein
MVHLVEAELTKCNAGAPNILENSTYTTSCSGNNSVLQTALLNYGNGTGKNLYDEGLPLYISSGTPANGQILVVADPGSTGKFTVTGTYLVSGTATSLGPTIINRE